MSDGWIKLHRAIQGWDFWGKEPFTRAQAWIDLLLRANHKDGGYFCRGIWVPLKRGQFAVSIETLAAEWRWSFGKVSRFISLLQTMEQIAVQKNSVITVTTIVNYDTYQTDDSTDRRANGRTNSSTDGVQTETYKNDKNVKNDKKGEAAPQNVISLTNAPTLEQAIKHFGRNGDYPESWVRKVWLGYEATKDSNGYWMRGRSRVGDWRAAMEERLYDDKQEEERSLSARRGQPI